MVLLFGRYNFFIDQSDGEGGGVRLSINFIDYKPDYFPEIGSSTSQLEIYKMFNIFFKTDFG